MSGITADLNPAWSYIEDQGLVRVVMTDSFKTGFVLTAHIGQAAEALDYYPEVTLAARKVTIAVDDSDAIKARQLARDIDALLTHDAD